MDKHLLIIDPSVATPEAQGVAEMARGFEGRITVLRPVLTGDGPDAATGHGFDGVVVMGSRASVLDADPWIAALREWLTPVLSGEIRIPVLGICFGHQLVAYAASGRDPASVGFVREDHSKVLGYAETTLTGSRLLPGTHTLRVIASHREEVKRLPPAYRCVAHRDGVLTDGLEHTELPIFAFQFHPEAREEFVGRAGLDPAGVNERLREDTQRLLGAFRDVVLGPRDI